MATAGQKIEGVATILRTGTATVNGPQECPYVVFEFGGREYRWQSEKAGWSHYSEGSKVNLRAFIRPDGRHLYRVSVTKLQPEAV